MTAKDTTKRQQEKQKLFDEWMKGEYVFVNINSKTPGVELPKDLMQQTSVTLKLSYLFHGEISYTVENITAYLKFSGEYFKCEIPWLSIWGMSNAEGKNQVWTDEIPKEVIVELYANKFKEMASSLFGKKNREEEEQQQTATEATDTTVAKPKKSGHLKLIK